MVLSLRKSCNSISGTTTFHGKSSTDVYVQAGALPLLVRLLFFSSIAT
jgi:hypothetical protein